MYAHKYLFNDISEVKRQDREYLGIEAIYTYLHIDWTSSHGLDT